MALYDSPAIVLKTSNIGEADQIISFFTRRFGKVKVFAKGTRRFKSRLISSLQPITLVDLIYFLREGQNLARINSCDIIYSFKQIKTDFEKIKRAYYVVELIDTIIPEGGPEPKLFNILVKFLRLLEKLEKLNNIDSLLRLFEWQILAFSGHKPRMDQCVFCKKIPRKNTIAISMASGGILCNPCSAQVPDAIKISPGSLMFIKRGLETDLAKTVNWKISGKLEKELREIAQRYFLFHLGKDIKTAKFLSL